MVFILIIKLGLICFIYDNIGENISKSLALTERGGKKGKKKKKSTNKYIPKFYHKLGIELWLAVSKVGGIGKS